VNAEEFARQHHTDKRKNGEPGISHQEFIVDRLLSLEVDDDTLAIAWLHDILEDNNVTYEQLLDLFGEDVADGVRLLTRDVGEEEYKVRLLSSPENIQLIKIIDTIHNIITLPVLSEKGQERKVRDCYSFYIPLAESSRPELAAEIRSILAKHKQ